MTETGNLYNSVAPLKNVAAVVSLIERIENRAPGLPGMATFFGFSGWGKTTGGIYAANKFQAVLVEVRSAWTAKKLCKSILTELGLKPANTVADMLDQIAESLARSGRPLLIDEADHLVSRRIVQIVRDIHDASGATVILIGEELLPQKLREWERVHGRMLDWVAAQPADMGDLGHLAGIYCPGIVLGQELKQRLLKASTGSVRRISVNLARLNEFALTRGLQKLGAEDFDATRFFTGEAPTPRKGVA